MTADQKKALTIVVAVVLGSYALRYAVTMAVTRPYDTRVAQMQAEAHANAQKQAQQHAAAVAAAKAAADAKKAKAAADAEIERQKKLAGLAANPPVEIPFIDLLGIWRGRVALPDRGLCDLKFEVQVKRREPGKAEGFSELVCHPAAGLGPRDAKTAVTHAFNPAAGVFTGTMQEGVLDFPKADRVLGNNCPPTSFRIAPQGAHEVSAQWTESKCDGGSAVLHKARG